MPSLSAEHLDNVLNFLLTKRDVPIQYRVVLKSVKAENDSVARFVIDKLVSQGLISKDYRGFVKIEQRGIDFINSGGFQNIKNANTLPSLGTALSNATSNFMDFSEARKKNPNAVGYTDKPLPFGGSYPNNQPVRKLTVVPIDEFVVLNQPKKQVEDEPKYIDNSIQMPLSLEPKVSRKRKFLDFIGHPDNKNVMQWIVWVLTIIVTGTAAVLLVFTFFKWVIPAITNLFRN